MGRQNDTRPKAKPTPVRFTEEILVEIDEVAADLAMSRQDVIRLSVSAGLKALKSLGRDGLVDRIALELEASEMRRAARHLDLDRVAEDSPKNGD